MELNMTYGTNVFGYPLFQVTGLISVNTVYNFMFGIINNEKKEAFN